MKYSWLLLFLVLLFACDEQVSDLSSNVDPHSETMENEGQESSDPASDPKNTNSSKAQAQKDEIYTFTNDFKINQGHRPYIRLVGNNKTAYIVPPVEYAVVKTKSAVIDGFKAGNGCVNVPASAFPLVVHVCLDDKCQDSRHLAKVNVAGHYSVLGVNSLFLLQINPASPCSDEFEKYIKTTTHVKPVSSL